MNELNLDKAISVSIGYFLNGKHKTITLSKRAEVQELLRLLIITSTLEGTQASLIPRGTLEFFFEDRKSVKGMFVSAENIDIFYWGQLFVTPDFYHKICEVISDFEGRRIDVLKDN